MKKLLMVAALVLSGAVNAAPVYYTFTGTVNQSLSPAGIITSTYGLADPNDLLGHAVEYVFLVDYQADGTQTLNDASVTTKVDTATVDWFYTDLVSGRLMNEKDGGSHNAPGDVAEYNWGFDRLDGIGFDKSKVEGGSGDSIVDVYSTSGKLSTWQIGDSFNGAEIAFDSLGEYDTIQSSLILTDISPAVVPVPAAAWLFGSGLGLLGWMRRKVT